MTVTNRGTERLPTTTTHSKFLPPKTDSDLKLGEKSARLARSKSKSTKALHANAKDTEDYISVPKKLVKDYKRYKDELYLRRCENDILKTFLIEIGYNPKSILKRCMAKKMKKQNSHRQLNRERSSSRLSRLSKNSKNCKSSVLVGGTLNTTSSTRIPTNQSKNSFLGYFEAIFTLVV